MSEPYRCTASALRIRDRPDGGDTGLRVIHDQVVRAHGISWDKGWIYVDAPAGAGWASAQYLQAAEEPEIREPSWPEVPHGLVAIRETFGEAGSPDCTAGTVALPEELRARKGVPLAWDGSARAWRFHCHVLLEPVFVSVFTEIIRRGHWGLIEDWGGCYNYRRARGLQKLSTHSWGIAVDLNVAANPLGATPTMPDELVRIFEDHGFLWGGRWSRPDGMHFQWATGY